MLQPNGVLRVSHSELQVFDRCRFKYDLSYNRGWTESKTGYPQTVGLLGHKLLEIWHSTYSEALLKQVITRWLGDLEYGDVEELNENTDTLVRALHSAVFLVDRYINKYADRDMREQVLSTEFRFDLRLQSPNRNEYDLVGVVDKVFQRDSGSGFRTWLKDYKFTGKMDKFTETGIMLDPQFTTYSAALRELGFAPSGFEVDIFNSYDYKKKAEVEDDKLFRRVTSYRTDTEMDNYLTWTGLVVDEMYAALEQKDWRLSIRSECNMCQSSDICLYKMKGFGEGELDSLLEEAFVQKGEVSTPVGKLMQIADQVKEGEIDG